MLIGPTVTTRTSDTFNNVGDLLIDRAGINSTTIADTVGSVSLGELVSSSLRLAHTLTEFGVKKGSTVVLMLPNSIDFVRAWFACTLAGAIQVPLNIAGRGQLLAHYLGLVQPEVIVCQHEFVPVMLEEIGAAPGVRAIIAADGSAARVESGIQLMPLRDAVTNTELVSRPTVDKYDPMSILFTSGTTGPSKGVVVSHSMAMWTGDQATVAANVSTDDQWYCCLPFFHVDAQDLVTMSALITGASVRISERFSASRFWDEVADCNATRFTFIGAILEILLKRHLEPLAARERPLVGIGSPVREHIYREFEQRFQCNLVDTFGMTEITNPIWGPLGMERPGAAGIVSADFEISIVDDDDTEVPLGEVGELLVRPKRPGTFFDGYYGTAQETVQAWRNLWFHTGDCVRRDADGYVYFVERKKDVIRRRGENVSAFEVEAVVSQLPGVLACAAVAVTAEFSEDEIRVFIVSEPEVSLDPEEVWRALDGSMAKYMVPRYLEFIEHLPMTATSKVDKRGLRCMPLGASTFDRDTFAEGTIK